MTDHATVPAKTRRPGPGLLLLEAVLAGMIDIAISAWVIMIMVPAATDGRYAPGYLQVAAVVVAIRAAQQAPGKVWNTAVARAAADRAEATR